MNFDATDPLGDILSDGSNDSFFDEPKVLKKRLSISKTPEKKPIPDFFNLNVDKNNVPKPETAIKSQQPSEKLQKPSKKISFDDDDNDDILGNLGLQKTNPQNEAQMDGEKKTSRKTDLIDSILAPTTLEQKSTSFDDILKSAALKSKPSTPTVQPQLPSKKTEPLQSTFSLSSDVPKEGRRGRRSSTLADPLGLFDKTGDSSETKLKQEMSAPSTETLFTMKSKELKTKSTPNIPEPDLPDWLGGSSAKPNKSEVIISHPFEKPDTQTESSINFNAESNKFQKSQTDISKATTESSQDILQPAQTSSIEDNQMFSTILQHQKLAQSDVEYQNSFISLQQQESQLLIALQLKKYEENLSKIQTQQQEVLVKQEKQFNMLLDRYFARQQVMENNMRSQQERINSHIQMLITQQPGMQTKNLNMEERMKESEVSEQYKFHEVLVEAMKQRHQEELFVTEESYKKQITLLEQQLEAYENRMKAELKSTTEEFEEKINNIKKNHEDEMLYYKEKLQKTVQEHVDDIKLMRENFNRIVEEIRHEHLMQIDNMKKMKEYETGLMGEGKKYSEKLDGTLEVLDVNNRMLNEMQEKMYDNYNVLNTVRENSLQVREKDMALMRESLEKSREMAEKERGQLLALVRSLETKLAEQEQSAREDRWTFQQAAATFAARTTALDREIEFNRASFEREREQLKTLKEQLLAEQEKILLQLTEEKLTVAVEKSRLDISNKLTTNFDSQKAKAEADAAIQIAKEATEMTDQEREKLHRQHMEVERMKRQLLDKENQLAEKKRELDSLIFDAERKAKDGEVAVQESKRIEIKYNERLRELQGQLSSLTNREKKLAEDKLNLSREKLTLYTAMRQSRKCGLCAVESGSNVLESNMEPFDLPRIISDPDAIRFRMEAMDDERNSEVSKEDS